MKFISKPIKPELVDAVEYKHGDWKTLDAFLGEHNWMIHSNIFGSIEFKTCDKNYVADNGDWIVRLNGGFVFVMKADDFRERYKPAAAEKGEA